MFLESVLAKFGPAFIDVDLVAFAKRHFGTGRLRKIDNGLCAVLRGTPAAAPVKLRPIPGSISRPRPRINPSPDLFLPLTPFQKGTRT
jgi:hypothetical protein